MYKKQAKKMDYLPPKCEVIETECESIICKVSVRPNEGGTVFFGDESTVAPAKESMWDYDDED